MVRARLESASFVAAVRELSGHVLDAVTVSGFVSGQEIVAAERLIDRLWSTLDARFGESWTKSRVEPTKVGPEVATREEFESWRNQATALLQEIQTVRVPLREAARLRRRTEFGQRVKWLEERLPAFRLMVLAHGGGAFVAGVLAEAERRVAGRRAALQAQRDAIPALPPGIRGWDSDLPLPAGPGPLLLCVGSATLVGPALVTLQPTSGGSQRLSVHELPFPSVDVPLILDLDRHGGLLTDSVDTVASLTLRLLALLPPGRLKVAVFDPQSLGDSAKFLYGLGEATEQVIGDKVRTTQRELADLLLHTEEHIAMVTQKYLQGQHATLTEYNAAAGEVAEPYRLLLLFDYPAGFAAGGYYDGELLNRLKKIINVGPRCGVFTVVVSPALIGRMRSDPTTAAELLELPTKASYEHDAASLAVASLPWLGLGRAIQADTMAKLTGVAVARSVTNKPLGYLESQIDRLRQNKDTYTRATSSEYWRFQPDPPLTPAQVADICARIERGLRSATDVRVTPRRVAELALAKLERDLARGTAEPRTIAHPDDPTTWWRGNSADGVEALFGRVGAADVAVLRLDSNMHTNALLGGRMGAGKSVWLHTVIASLCQQYSPEELELYLVDFKEGVEFKVYASGRLPHARVVAVEAERDFGLSVLSAIDAEIRRRGELLRGTDGHPVGLSSYRARTGQPMPRIVLVIDEFHVLFREDDRIASTAGTILERIVREGRAFGVNTILASQTLAGTAGVGKHLFGLIPIRVALQSSDADSRLLLADDNPDARLLTRHGEGILNTKGGIRDANIRFQTAYWEPEDREELVRRLRAMADQRGFTRGPVVFERREPARVTDLAELASATPQRVNLPLGLPMSLDGPLYAALRREPGGHLLLVVDESAAYGLLSVGLVAVAAGGVTCDVLDYGSPEAPWAPVLNLVAARPTVTVTRSRTAAERLREVADLVDKRQAAADYQSPAHVVFLVALHRARDFDATAYDSEHNARLERILRDGPDVGVHVVAWCDKVVSVERRLSSAALREFSLRVLTQASKEDSFRLIDSDLAASLPGAQAVFDDHDRAVMVRFRWFEQPPGEWVARMAGTS